MNIQEILEKTKKKSESIITNRRPPSIATDFRPYDTDFLKSLPADKPETNRQQTDNKETTKPITNNEQTDNKQATSEEQKTKTDNKPVTEPTTKPVTIKQQTDNKATTELTPCSFSSLTGVQRAILLVIYEECKGNRSKHTREMTLEYILNSLYEAGVQTTTGSIKTSLQRLENKRTINRKSFKNGRGGWSQYELNDNIYRDIMAMYEHGFRNKPITNWQQTNNKPITELITQPATTPLSSSSLINKTTTITNEEKNELPEEWKEIDIESLEGLIRFHPGHVKQLFKHGLDLKPVQESIYHYAFDLTENNKAKDIKTDPISFFMGIMKRSGYYAAPENYESAQTRGRRLFLEQEAKKAEQLLAAEKATMNAYLEIWLNKLSVQEKTEMVGKDEMVAGRGILMQSDKLKKHYKDVIWPAHYQKILNGVE